MAFNATPITSNGVVTNSNEKPAEKLPFAERPAAYGWKTRNERGYEILERPAYTRRKLRVVGVGAGASGINLAKSVRDDLTDVDIVIYEENPEVGGTW